MRRPTVRPPGRPAGTLLSGRALWLCFAVTTTGTFMVNFDASVVSVILPVLSQQFRISVTELEWVVSAYLLVVTALIPTLSRAADIFGRKRVFLVGVLTFITGSAWCATAGSFPMLVAARAFQGMGAAAMMANMMAIVSLIFPLEQRGRALGLSGSVVAAGTLLGPPIGGFMTVWLGWRSIFWVNIPIGIWALAGTLRYMPKFVRRPVPLDLGGALGFALFAVLLELGLTRLHQASGWVLTAAALTSLALFLRWEAKVESPLIPLKLFRISAFSRSVFSGLMYWVMFMFPNFMTPLYLHFVRHWGESVIGLVMMAQPVASLMAAPIGGWMTDRTGPYRPSQVGMVILLFANFGMTLLNAASPAWMVILGLALLGVGAGIFNTPNNTQMITSAGPENTGMASGIAATQRNMGRAVSISLISIALSMTWIILGVGPTLPLHHSHYGHWLLAGFHSVFWVGVGLSLAGLGIMSLPEKRAMKNRADDPPGVLG